MESLAILSSTLENVISPVVYYLITLLAIQAAFFIANEHWRRGLSPYASKFVISFGAIGGFRILILFLVAFDSSGRFPLELVMGVISLGFLAWTFSPHLNNRPSQANLLLIIHTALAFMLLGIDIFVEINLHGIWYIWQIGLSLLTFVSTLLMFGHAPFVAMVGVLVLLVGSLSQPLIGPDFMTSLSNPVVIRLSEIIAYIILGVAVYWEMISSLNLYSQNLKFLSDSTHTQIQELTSLFEATKNITAVLDLAQVLDGATKGVVEALNVDQCTIIMPEENEPNQLRLMAIYNRHKASRGAVVTFPAKDQRAIKYAMERGHAVSIDEKRAANKTEIKLLFAMMGADEDLGPILIQPLISKEKSIGVLVIGNAHSKRPFENVEARFIETMANQITIAIENARTYQNQLTKVQQLAWTLRNQEQEAERSRAAMIAEISKSRESVTLMSQRLQEQEALARKIQKELTDYQQLIIQLNNQYKTAHESFKQLSAENQRLLSSSEARQKQDDILQKAEEKIHTLTNRVQKLELEASEAHKLQEALTIAQERSRKLTLALRRSRAKAQAANAMPTSLTNPKHNPELESLSFGLIISDETGKINRINEATANLLKISTPNLIGHHLTTLTSNPNWQIAVEKLISASENPISTNLNINQNIIKATISPITDPNHQVNGYIILLYDATAEFEHQQSRDEFVASLSQELRTPMTSIAGYMDLLSSESVGVLEDMQRKFLQRINANIERMNGMLDDLVGVTTIDAGRLDLAPAQLNMAEAIEDAIIGAKAQIQEKDIQIQLNLPDKIPPVEADPYWIQQILQNLLSNAIQSTPVGGLINVSAAITTQSQASTPLTYIDNKRRWLKVSIMDSGGGIAEKDHSRVFDPAYKADTPLIQGIGDTGVGLSIVKHLIEAHQGEVWFETEMGVGSTFYFTLLISDYLDDPWDELDIPPLDLHSPNRT